MKWSMARPGARAAVRRAPAVHGEVRIPVNAIRLGRRES